MVEKNKVLAIPALKIREVVFKVKGDSPLLQEKMDSSVAERYDKKKSKKLYKEDSRSEEDKVMDKIHYTSEGNIGYPTSGFLGGMLDVAPRINGKNFPNKIDIKQGIRFVDEIVPIDFEKQDVHEAIGRTSGMSKAPRLIMRPQFHNWSADLRIVYNEDIFSLEQVANLLNWAGFNCGLGGWRPSCTGIFGRYHIASKGGN